MPGKSHWHLLIMVNGPHVYSVDKLTHTQSILSRLMMSEYVNQGCKNCVHATSPWMGTSFCKERRLSWCPWKGVCLCPLQMCEAWPRDHNHGSRNGAQADVRGTGTTSVHREHSSGKRKLPLGSTVKDLRGKQAGGGATQVLPVLWGHNTSRCCIAYLDILSGLNLLHLCWNDFLVAHPWLSSSNAKGEWVESLGTDLQGSRLPPRPLERGGKGSSLMDFQKHLLCFSTPQ